MFNSPILDLTIGLVFIFLSYSLLATSINEAIAASFALRARMLRNAIAERMLSNISEDTRWQSIRRGVRSFFSEILRIFYKSKGKNEADKKIGDKFYDHPLIKNYSSSRVFSMPSYISRKNFSTVLIDTLKKDFDQNKEAMVEYKQKHSASNESDVDIRHQLEQSPDIIKVKELLEHYARHFSKDDTSIANPIIDNEVLDILRMELNSSMYNFEKFIQQIEQWYDDTMDRVVGWYKRQAQTILFLLGLVMAILFNVDTIEIVKKLSKDDEAREKLVQLAIEATDKYKDDPRVKKMVNHNGEIVPDTNAASRDSNIIVYREYQAQLDSIKDFIRGDLATTNNVLALGWGDYGMLRDSAEMIKKCLEKDGSCRKGNLILTKSSSAKERVEILKHMYDTHWIKYKVCYVWCEFWRGVKITGFLITAFAISLGAPFWFDLLNKLVKVRAAGKKEGESPGAVTSQPAASPPITINMQPQPGEEAVG